jgi:integrase
VEKEVRQSMSEAIRLAREENWPYPFMYAHRWGRKLTEDELVRNNYARYWAEIKEAFEGKISTHDFRRTYAIRVYNLYKDINLVKAALHHERITDTERYIKEILRINPLRLAEDVQVEEKPKAGHKENEPEEM